MSCIFERIARARKTAGNIFNYIIIRISVLINCSFICNWVKCENLEARLTKINRITKFTDMVESHGYPSETHTVKTEDGYILTVHRIPPNPKLSDFGRKDPVIFLHGLSGSSEAWVMNGPGKDLALITADAGYDVWLLNTRGNFYSRKHETLNPDKDRKFWQFSFHEYGFYDIPAAVDYILEKTRKEKVFLIGHSMGAMLPFVTLSARPEYNEKVDVVFSLAPGAIFTQSLPQPAKFLFHYVFGSFLRRILIILNYQELVPRNLPFSKFLNIFDGVFKPSAIQQKLFLRSSVLIRTGDFNVANPETFGRWIRHFPQGTSLDTFYHFRQIMTTGKFRQFDHGLLENVKHYKAASPPFYPMEKISASVIIYYSANDPLITETDIDKYLKLLPNARAKLLDDKKFGHHEFVMTDRAKELFGDDIIREMNKRSLKNR